MAKGEVNASGPSSKYQFESTSDDEGLLAVVSMTIHFPRRTTLCIKVPRQTKVLLTIYVANKLSV
jgi:hypothetical protein